MLKRGLLLLIAGILSWSPAFADEQITPELVNSLGSALPGMKPDRVSHSPIEGLYELAFGPHIVYVTKDGRYMVRGDVFDLAKRENLTEGKRKQARIDAINGLGENGMIVFAPKTVKHTITVFTDHTCPYCQTLHRQIGELNRLGIKVRYLAFPRAGIPSSGYDGMVSVWCADDQQKAMTDAKAGRPVAPKRCDNPVRKHYEMGQLVGVRGTPTLILEDGELVPGYVPPKRLVQLIEAGRSALSNR